MLLQRGPGWSHGRQIDVLHFKSSTWPLLANEMYFVNADGFAHTSERPSPLIVEV